MDELSPSARALLDAAHGNDDPLPDDADRIRRAVLVRIGSVGFGAALYAMSVEPAKALLGATLPKVVAVALIAVGGSALYHHWKVSAPQVARSSLAIVAPAARVQAPAARPIAEPTPEAAATPDVVPPPVVAPRAPQAVAAEAHRTNLEAEMRWVRAADAALRGGDVGLAVSLLNQHAREFPHGALAEEREGLRVVAGCQGGGASPVVQRAASRFLQRAPRSLMAGRVRAACLAVPETGG